MKTIFLIIALSLALYSPLWAITSETEQCVNFWTTSFASATADAPDAIYCRKDNGTWQSMGASYAQYAAGADDVTVTWDTDIADGSTTINTILGAGPATAICSNEGATISLQVLGSSNGTQFSEGGVYYYNATSLADEDANTFSLTPIRYLKYGATEASGTAACLVVYSTVTWIKR